MIGHCYLEPTNQDIIKENKDIKPINVRIYYRVSDNFLSFCVFLCTYAISISLLI